MSNLRVLLVAVLLLLPSLPLAAFEVYVSVDDYMAASRAERVSFLAGVFDTFNTLQDAELLSSRELSQTVQRIADCTSPMTLNEIETLFTASLDKQREDWDSAAAALFIFTFDDYCR